MLNLFQVCQKYELSFTFNTCKSLIQNDFPSFLEDADTHKSMTCFVTSLESKLKKGWVERKLLNCGNEQVFAQVANAWRSETKFVWCVRSKTLDELQAVTLTVENGLEIWANNETVKLSQITEDPSNQWTGCTNHHAGIRTQEWIKLLLSC